MPSRAAQLAGLSLSRSVSEGLWQPALHQEASHSVNKPTQKRRRESQERRAKLRSHRSGREWLRPHFDRKNKASVPVEGRGSSWYHRRLSAALMQQWLKGATAIVVARFVGTLIWNSNIGQISTSKEHVTPWLTYSTSIIFLFSCPVIWNLFLAIRGAVFPQPIF